MLAALSRTLQRALRGAGSRSGTDAIVLAGPGCLDAVAGDGRFLWVAASHAATVTRIEPRSRNVPPLRHRRIPDRHHNGRLHRSRSPRAAFAVAGHRDGTLTVGNDKLPGTSNGIDPANLYYYWTSAAERFVYDGLIAYRAADEAAGYTFVPDLAARLPEVSPDRKTYTFTVRRGIVIRLFNPCLDRRTPVK